ncbi:MAG: NUDIX domain-containing protein [Prevotellaceae bacterium]|jgi:mutator protein MutT|nr:NUDIX domain-containing protein [Prevotellaceae bacterium]
MNEFHPSRVFKFCPFCGTEKFVWNGANAFVCNECTQTFYINMAAAVVAVIYNDKNEILLTRRKHNPAKGLLDLPGGFVNLGETAENAVIREVKEELNIDISELKFIATFPNEYVFGGIQYFTEDIVFLCKVADFSNISANDDISNYEFRKVDEININEIGLLSIKNVINKLKEQNK